MASYYLPEKGSHLAPCEPTCQHTDCAEGRRRLAIPCPICHLAVKPGQRVYHSGEGYSHAVCEEEQVERDLAARS